jgi:two-component system LytT family response regulator
MIIRALLVDDELSAIRWMLDLFRLEPSIQVIGKATNFRQAEKRIAEGPIDVVFLDIQLRRHNGLDLLDRLDKNTRVVLVTAHEEYALRGYELGVIDYLLKPVFSDRLAVTVERLHQSLGSTTAPPKPDSNTMLSISTADSMVLIEPEKILWIEAENNNTWIHVESGVPVMLRRTLSEWENTLSERQFGRIGRSLIINLSRMREMTLQEPYVWRLKFNDTMKTLKIGAAAGRGLRKILSQISHPLP